MFNIFYYLYRSFLAECFRFYVYLCTYNVNDRMKRLFFLLFPAWLLVLSMPVVAQPSSLQSDTTTAVSNIADTVMADSAALFSVTDVDEPDASEHGLHKLLKQKFIEGSAGFMSLVALALVIGLAFCIERLVYITLSEINAKRFMADIDSRLSANDVDGARQLCLATRGPVASICYHALLHINESLEDIDRYLTNYGTVQIANMEKGCSWIKLFIAVAPSLGFLGTVIGMVMAFDQIQTAGDISPTIVASGMKVALITTIFGIIVAIILQFFYNYILSKIEHLSSQMEESAITLMDSVGRWKKANQK